MHYLLTTTAHNCYKVSSTHWFYFDCTTIPPSTPLQLALLAYRFCFGAELRLCLQLFGQDALLLQDLLVLGLHVRVLHFALLQLLGHFAELILLEVEYLVLTGDLQQRLDLYTRGIKSQHYHGNREDDIITALPWKQRG